MVVNNDINNKLSEVKCFVLDMDGTFYLEETLIDGALDFIKAIERTGRQYYFYTNNSSKDAKSYVDRLSRLGLDIPDEQLLISNQVIINYLKHNHKGESVFLLGTPLLRKAFVNSGINLTDEKPDIVVVGFDTTLNYENLTKACTYIREGSTFYAVNPDFNCPVQGGFIPDCGSICALITASTGKKPTYFGKPEKKTLDFVIEKTGFKESEIAFVGDRLYTDIAIGKGTMATTILVLSGECQLSDLEHSDVQPTLIYDSVKELGQALR